MQTTLIKPATLAKRLEDLARYYDTLASRLRSTTGCGSDYLAQADQLEQDASECRAWSRALRSICMLWLASDDSIEVCHEATEPTPVAKRDLVLGVDYDLIPAQDVKPGQRVIFDNPNCNYVVEKVESDSIGGWRHTFGDGTGSNSWKRGELCRVARPQPAPAWPAPHPDQY